MRQRNRRLTLTLTAASLVAAAIGVAAAKALFVRDRRDPDEVALDIMRTDVPAPEITLVGPDGKPFHLEPASGELLFVNFWATWCPPCRDEMPSMIDLARDLTRSHPGKFKMVAVSADESWGDVQRYFQDVFGGIPPDITVARDPTGKAALAYYCSARGACPDIKFPETYIVDGAGRLVAYIISSRDWRAPAARQFLERLLAR